MPATTMMTPSLSARRAWIEIIALADVHAQIKSLSARRAWIEMLNSSSLVPAQLSLSARRAWIEIALSSDLDRKKSVALRKESVD